MSGRVCSTPSAEPAAPPGGYQLAGFHVTGVDNRPQPRYCGEAFVQADALEYIAEHGAEYDAIHASPPCQFYSRLRHLPWLRDRVYWDSIPPTRKALEATGVPWVLENIEDAPLDPSIILCGAALGLSVSRHRRFELSGFWMLPPPCPGHATIEAGRATLGKRYAHSAGTTGILKEISRETIAGHVAGIELARTAMACEWMTRDELTQAIPPAMTEVIGAHLLAALRPAAA